MRKEPLFIRFANGQSTAADVADAVEESSRDTHTQEIVRKAREDLPDLRVFKDDLQKAVADLIDNGPDQHFKNYVNSYMKPSLEEFVEGGSGNRAGERRWVKVKAADTPWLEAVVCYNLCLYVRAFGIKELKHCPVCKKFFSHKGKYAKYCSDVCKGQGKGS